MKKIISILIAALLLIPCFTAFASAEKFTSSADALHDMGLFLGTDNGYELDRKPTRAEAATMLVRLLGKESAAKKLTYTAPFTDVPKWAEPYVQYLYENDLTKGTSGTSYSPGDLCTAQMYVTFILRALGYSDSLGDFSYDKAIDFAKQKKILNSVNYDETNFLRDHVVAISFTALFCQTADNRYTMLLNKLEADGAIDSNSAKSVRDLFNFIKDYDNAVSQIINDRYSLVSNFDVYVTLNGKDYMHNQRTDEISVIISSLSDNLSSAVIHTNSSTFYNRYDRQIDTETWDYYIDGTAYKKSSNGEVSVEADFADFISNYQCFDYLYDKICLLDSYSKYYDSHNFVFNEELSSIYIDQLISGIKLDVSYSDISLSSIECTMSTYPKLSTELKCAFSAKINGSEFEFTIVSNTELVQKGDLVKLTYPTDNILLLVVQ